MKQLTQRKPSSALMIALDHDLAMRVTRPAVFLDRDGTLNEDVGYVLNMGQLKLLPSAADAVRLLNDARLSVIVVTNQSPIGRGLLSLTDLNSINHRLEEELADAGAQVDALYYCPHDPDINPSCECRKPQPGLILQAAVDMMLDLRASYLVGDKWSDIIAGRRAGCKTILILSRSEQTTQIAMTKDTASLDYVAHDVLEAVHWILDQCQSSVARA